MTGDVFNSCPEVLCYFLLFHLSVWLSPCSILFSIYKNHTYLQTLTQNNISYAVCRYQIKLLWHAIPNFWMLMEVGALSASHVTGLIARKQLSQSRWLMARGYIRKSCCCLDGPERHRHTAAGVCSQRPTLWVFYWFVPWWCWWSCINPPLLQSYST